MKSVYLKFDECNTDPVQFKPYSPKLSAPNVYVRFYVPDDAILQEGKQSLPIDAVVLTPEGVCAILSQMAKAIRFNISVKTD